ncbi:MAG: molybdopterin cofactor-binding domain-containing protein [Steroidobacteraceae bacterium]
MQRRQFIKVAASASGGMLVSCSLPLPGLPDTPPEVAAPQRIDFNAYLQIETDGTVHITCPQSELGQGVLDGLPRLVAEELDADWASVHVHLPQADDALRSPVTKRQRTAASQSVQSYFDVMRQMGATARLQLVSEAAARWGITVDACRTEASQVIDEATGRKFGYGELCTAAALRSAGTPVLKDRSQYRLLGTRQPRKDTPGKCDGSAEFGLDLQLPGLRYAVVRRSTAVAATVKDYDKEAALALPGVEALVALREGVAVIADSTYRAMRAAAALRIEFDESASAMVDSDAWTDEVRRALDDQSRARPGRQIFSPRAYDVERTRQIFDKASRRLSYEYSVPFLAHAAMEPLNATVLVGDGKVEIWAPTQQPDRLRDLAATMCDVDVANVRVNVLLAGGGFGRKHDLDFTRQAIEIALARPGTPIKLTWTREQDFQHDRYRPGYGARFEVALDSRNKVTSLRARSAGIDVWKSIYGTPFKGMADPISVTLLINDMYDLPDSYSDFVAVDWPVPVGTWRSVSSSMNCFFFESALDELALDLGKDPLQLRLDWLAQQPRAQRVLQLVADRAGWSQTLPAGQGRGIAFSPGFGSFCAAAIRVGVAGNRLSIAEVHLAIDCGLALDPGTVEAQLEGGAVFGLTAAIDGEILFSQGRSRASNFNLAPIMRMAQLPPINVHIVPGEAGPGGVGEAGVPPVAPALANAIAAAGGKRPRSLPVASAGYRFV